MPERKLIDIDQAHQLTAPNGAIYDVKVDNTGTFTTTLRTAAASATAQALWKVNSYSGSGALQDLSGNGHHMAFPGGSNNPKYLAYSGTKYLYLPGLAGNYASVPDSNALDITGDIDIRWKGALNTWSNGSDQALVSKYGTAGSGQLSYYFRVNSTGFPMIRWSADGAVDIAITSTTAVPFDNGVVGWLRVLLDVDNGLGGKTATFYSSTDGVNWTQLSSITTGGTTSIFAGPGIVTIGVRGTDNTNVSPGVHHRAIIRNVVNDLTVLDIDFSKANASSSTFTAETGQTVTINRSTSGPKSVVVDRPLLLFGGDDYLETPHHTLLNFGVVDSFTIVAAFRVWNNPADQQIINKRAADSSAGWEMYRNNTAGRVSMLITDGTNLVYPETATGVFTQGMVGLFAMRRNVAADDMRMFFNGIQSGIARPDTITSSIANSLPVRIGRTASGSTQYADMEFIGAAIFRRALTDAEIMLLAGEFGV